MWMPTPAEIENVSKLGGPDRYRYLVKKVADTEAVWSLWRDGWALAADDILRTLVPVWPHSTYAARCATGPWSGYETRDIPLRDFIDRWLPGMVRDGRLVAAFPTPEGKGLEVDPLRMRDDLAEELEQYID